MKYFTIQEDPKLSWRVLFQPSTLDLMVYVESLEGMEYSSFHYVMITDELDVDGSYKEHNFNIWMEWGGGISLIFENDISEQIATEIEEHLRSYKYVGRQKTKSALERFRRLAKSGN